MIYVVILHNLTWCIHILAKFCLVVRSEFMLILLNLTNRAITHQFVLIKCEHTLSSGLQSVVKYIHIDRESRDLVQSRLNYWRSLPYVIKRKSVVLFSPEENLWHWVNGIGWYQQGPLYIVSQKRMEKCIIFVLFV